MVDIAQVVQAQLNKAGFDVQLNVQEQGKFIQDWRASNFEGFVSLNGGGPDPDDYFGRTFQTGGATNVFKYSNPDLDKLLIAARAETDAAQAEGDVQSGAAHPRLHRPRNRPRLRHALHRPARRRAEVITPIATRSLRYLRETRIGK